MFSEKMLWRRKALNRSHGKMFNKNVNTRVFLVDLRTLDNNHLR